MTKKILQLQNNTLNIIKLVVFHPEPKQMVVDVKYEKKPQFGAVVSEDATFSHEIPVSSKKVNGIETCAEIFEQYIFFNTDDFFNKLVISIEETCELITTCLPVTYTASEQSKILRILTGMGNKFFLKEGRSVNQFVNVNKAMRSILSEKRIKAACMHARLQYDDALYANSKEILIGYIGDDLFGGMLSSSFEVISLSEENLFLAEENLLDLVVIKKYSVDLPIDTPSLKKEDAYLNAVVEILKNSDIPVYEIDGNSGERFVSKLRPLLNCKDTSTYEIREHELCNYIPKKSSAFHVYDVAISTASDIYQYGYFHDLVEELIVYGFNVTIFEANYDHVPLRTSQRFGSEKVKVYGKLTPNEMAGLLHACNFLIIPSESLRSEKDLVNLCVMGLMNGAIPLFYGPKEFRPFGEMVKYAYAFSEAYDYLMAYTTRLARERCWLSMFREFSNIRSTGNMHNLFLQLAKNCEFSYLPAPNPKVEIICVTKRLYSFGNIIKSFERQTYEMLAMHVILNISNNDRKQAEKIIEQNASSDFRITIMDQSYNIGSCLNYGIRSSRADYWFKMDDDDYYGRHYIEDMINWYQVSGADVVGKMAGFVYFEENDQTYLRKEVKEPERRFLQKGKYFVGATLSGKIDRDNPLFSTSYRNACDSKWVEVLHASDKKIFIGDIFNFVVVRGDVKQHTWQIGHKHLMKRSQFVCNGLIEGYFDV